MAARKKKRKAPTHLKKFWFKKTLTPAQRRQRNTEKRERARLMREGSAEAKARGLTGKRRWGHIRKKLTAAQKAAISKGMKASPKVKAAARKRRKK